ncbi:STE3-domain-containing protein [Coprinopsis marcescibilis]|uniref:STE3-domain-containing protein n=1 Tax=Coprinopsis marcescibilis TaxID=230819 RepID=A0A5C3LB33_COPMA|nr:STE3-domain-containing protein [Coprinopsis marcescibilis]
MANLNQAYAAVSFITLILVLIPLPWHLEAWNTGTVLYIFWTAISLLNYFINAVVWNNNTENWAPAWCDISTKFMVGVALAIPCCSLCINRRMYHIASIRTVRKSRQEKIRSIIADCCIGLLAPAIFMALHHVVQGHRFDILEDLGCVPSTYNVTVAHALITAPLLGVPLVTIIYAVLSIVAFKKRDAEFKEVLASSSGSQKNMSRYFRLIALASVSVVVGFPLTLAATLVNVTKSPVQPWISWEETHYDFWRVAQAPATVWKSSPNWGLVESNRWYVVISGLTFFAFFGFADEAISNYTLWAKRALELIGVKWRPGCGNVLTVNTFGNSPLHFNTGTLPIYVQKEVIKRRDSISSFATFTSVGSFVEKAPTRTAPTPLKQAQPPSPTITVSDYDSPDSQPPISSFLDLSVTPTPESRLQSPESAVFPIV